MEEPPKTKKGLVCVRFSSTTAKTAGTHVRFSSETLGTDSNSSVHGTRTATTDRSLVLVLSVPTVETHLSFSLVPDLLLTLSCPVALSCHIATRNDSSRRGSGTRLQKNVYIRNVFLQKILDTYNKMFCNAVSLNHSLNLYRSFHLSSSSS